MQEIVCVTGGSGGIGQALLEQLVKTYEVKALFRTRNAMSEQWAKQGCHIVWGDLGNAEALAALVTGTQYVFHCAAIVIPGASYQEIYEVNVEGTRRLARLAAQNGCQRFIHISSIAVYSGTSSAEDYAEELRLRADPSMDSYSLTKLYAEQAVQEIAEEYGMEYVILRPTYVYGPHTKPFTTIPIDMIRQGRPVMLGKGTGVLDAVYVEDVVSAILLAAQSPKAHGEIFNIGHDTVTFQEFYTYYSRMLQRPARHLPLVIVHAVLKCLHYGPSIVRKKFPEMSKNLTFFITMAHNTKRYPSTKAKALLGYTPRFSLSMGMLKTALWLRQTAGLPADAYTCQNYGPLYTFHPVAVAHPRTEDEMVHIVHLARQHQLTVRAIGSLHSLSPVPVTTGICIVLDHYASLLKRDGYLVTVQAGMKICDLHEALAQQHLALPVNGSITEQTVAGAVSTATHGGSIHHGTLSDYVAAVRLIKADGSIVDIHCGQEPFHAVVVSMGLLGILSTITFRCIPAFALKADSVIKTTSEVIENFTEIHQGNAYVDMLYFPIIDRVAILAINSVGGTENKPYDTNLPLVKSRFSRYCTTVRLKGILWVLYLLQWQALQRWLTQLLAQTCHKARTGRSDFVLSFTDLTDIDPYPVQDMEIAVPYQHASSVLGMLRQHFMTTQQYPLLPIHIRCSAASNLWLSPSYKRDVCWLEFWQYPPSDDFFRHMHTLLQPLQYRFHWGKQTQASRDYIQPHYEKWQDFAQLRQQWDAQDLFLNPYLASFFGKQP